MIAAAMVQEIKRLLNDGKLSHRKIAELVGISRATIGAIASGKRPDYDALRLARQSELEPLGPVERCAGCGGLVYTPCRLCRVRKLKEQQESAARDFRRRAREQGLKRLVAAVVKARGTTSMTEAAEGSPQAFQQKGD